MTLGATVVFLMGLGGCGDPGLPTPGIALVTATAGTTSLVSQTCDPAATLEMSSGPDLWSDPEVRVKLDEADTSQDINLSALAQSGRFLVGDQGVVDRISGPFAVRLYSAGGAPVGAVVFDGAPTPGHGLVVLRNGDSDASVVDAADVERLNRPAC
ncbi:hypothetical protein [Cellulomonas sp. URHB0016]